MMMPSARAGWGRLVIRIIRINRAILKGVFMAYLGVGEITVL
jgi:hypothetical protein